METWFTLPEYKAVIEPPPKWKMAIVAFIAAYAISALSRSILPPFIGSWPLLIQAIVYTGILVVLLTFVTMPKLSLLLRRWLYSENANNHLGR
jgi:antibiotic biosynthesis monooxygenase (ABM) superfamily enzyme